VGIAVLLFLPGIFTIGSITPGYGHVRQTAGELSYIAADLDYRHNYIFCA